MMVLCSLEVRRMKVMASIRNYIVLSCSKWFGDSVGGTVGASVDAFVGEVVGAFIGIGCIVGTFVGLHHWCIGRVSLVVPAMRFRDMCIEL